MDDFLKSIFFKFVGSALKLKKYFKVTNCTKKFKRNLSENLVVFNITNNVQNTYETCENCRGFRFSSFLVGCTVLMNASPAIHDK